MSGSKPRFPAARIKKLMQIDDDVGKIAAKVPPLVSKALELFAAELVSKASAVAQNEHAKILQPSHIKACVETDDELSFLRDTVAKTPAPQAPKRKRPPAADRGGTASKRQGGGSHVGSGVAALSGGTSIAAGSSAASSHVLAETVADFIPPEDDDYDDF